jgi:carboxypeptidase Q
MLSRKAFLGIAIAMPLLLLAEEKVDLSIVNRIKTEAFENSKVMDHAFYLTDVNGGRLTGSPGFKAAAEWVATRLNEYGLKNVALEPWGPFGRGWSYSHFSASMTEPQYSPLIGFPLAWSKGTNGVVSGQPMMAIITTEADLDKFKGKLAGKIVMLDAARDLTPITTPLARRYTDAELAEQSMAPDPSIRNPFSTPQPPVPDAAAAARGGRAAAAAPDASDPRERFAAARRLRAKLQKFLADEGVVLVLRNGRGDLGTVFGQSSGSQDIKEQPSVPTIGITPEHYNRIVRLLENKIPVKVEAEYKVDITEGANDSVNVVGEIPGNGRKKDEVVMVGAHLDSWHGGTGATDNAAGCAVAMEAMRILKTLNLKTDRTVRIALWGGEEEGLLGSKAYVKKHFADPEVMKPLPEHAKLDAYFNLDNGTGKIRGIYMQGNDMVRPIFEAWLAPFRDLGATTVTNRKTGSTDHVSFDAVGLPGFQFIQDDVEYMTRTHHSNMDVYDHLQKGDLMQASAIMAAFIYEAATRDEAIPRKMLPKPQPAPRMDGTRPDQNPPSGKPPVTTEGAASR